MRTAAIALLTEAGINDWNTLSLFNIASAESRRALAAGFTEADLPMLAKIFSIITIFDVDDDAVNTLLDPNSQFRRSWDAALTRLADNDLNRKANLTVEQKIAVASAIAACDEDEALIAAVIADIKVIILNNEDNLRTENGIAQRVNDVRGNLEKINTATANYPEALAMAKQQTYYYRKAVIWQPLTVLYSRPSTSLPPTPNA